jgi:uncharacterized membrane protein
MQTIFKVLLIAVLLVIIDGIYLSSVASYFDKQISVIQGSRLKMDYLAAILCYVFIVAVVYYFIIDKKAPIRDALILGWCVYLIYELTNKAILSKWSWKTVLLDGVWGGILFALTTVAYRLIMKEPIKL